MVRFALVFALFVLALAPGAARADGYYGGNPDRAPSVFTYGMRGLSAGALVGLSGGYLSARRHGLERDDWRPLVLGTGIGALAGAGVGLTLGFVDLAADYPGRGAIALRDVVYGAGFGALLGLVAGSLVIVRTHEAEHALLGTAIGTLSGSAVGLAIGIVEGRRITTSPAHGFRRVSFGLASTLDLRGTRVLGPALAGRF